MGDTARRLSAAFLALALLIGALPGTNWTAAPTDPDLAAGDYALVQVAHGTAGAVAAEATADGATDVAALDKLDIVTANSTAIVADPFAEMTKTAVAVVDNDARPRCRPRSIVLSSSAVCL